MFPVYYIMGVAGSGKTTIGFKLAQEMQLPFLDGDDFHSAANKSKMAAGIPLNDEDREEWLQHIHAKALEASRQSGAVIACSALKQSYRDLLQQDLKPVHWIYLKGSYDTILQRMKQRQGHFMPDSLLSSQFETLEEPSGAITIDISKPPHSIIEQIREHMQQLSSFGIIGLGVMGKSLARNAASKNIRLSVYNRHVPGEEENVAAQLLIDYAEMKGAGAFDDLKAFVQSLETPRKILVMVNAGEATDAVLEALLPLLLKDDIVMDGGNSHYRDTERRMKRMKEAGFHWMGCGISGGEDGALKGPSIMAGGELPVYAHCRPLLETLAAKDFHGHACCTLAGPGGAGHFVKMVHNGIEYAEMQALAEVYHLMRRGMQMTPDAIATELENWNTAALESYLLGITVHILRKKEGNDFLIDLIADKAAGKGTGSWATQSAAALGVPATMLTQALFARFMAARQEERKAAAQSMVFERNESFGLSLQSLRQAYVLVRVINHQQGFDMVKAAVQQYAWDVDLAALASSWTNGCIIRSKLMEEIAELGIGAGSFLWSAERRGLVEEGRTALKETSIAAVKAGLAIPVISDALQYLHGMVTVDSPMNLVQAQRDYFGAHTYQRKDDPGGRPVHTRWQE